MLYKIIHDVVHIDYSDVLIENTNPILSYLRPFPCIYHDQKLMFIILAIESGIFYQTVPSLNSESSPNIDLFITL